METSGLFGQCGTDRAERAEVEDGVDHHDSHHGQICEQVVRQDPDKCALFWAQVVAAANNNRPMIEQLMAEQYSASKQQFYLLQ